MEQYTVCEFDGASIYTKLVTSLKAESLDRLWHLSDVKYNRAMQTASLCLATVTTCSAILFT